MANFSLVPAEGGQQPEAAPAAPVQGKNFTLTPADAPTLGAIAKGVKDQGRTAADMMLTGSGQYHAPVQKLGKLPFTHQTILAMMDNPEERKAFLEKEYGAGTVSHDKKGLIVKGKDGKPLRASSGFFANLAADAPETVLGIAGAAQGAAGGSVVGPAGTFVGAVGGAIAGAAAGKTLKEGAKAVTGTYRKTPGQYARGVAGAAEGGAIGEMGGRVVGPVLGRLTRGPLPTKVTGATPESKEMTKWLTSQGAMPHPQSSMPDARAIQRAAIRADKLSGPSERIERANRGYLRDISERILNRAGVPGGTRQTILRSMEEKQPALSTQQTGQLVQSSAATRLREFEQMMQHNRGATPTAQTQKGVAYLRQMAAVAKTPEQAYNYLVHGAETDKLQKFVQIMGPESPVVRAVQQQALRHAFSGAMIEVGENNGMTGLTKWMNQFTEQQQRMLFPNGLDHRLRLLDREIKFLYPKITDPSMAGMTTGNQMEKRFYIRWWHQGVGGLYRSFLQHPKVIDRLANGFEGTSTTRKASKAALKEMFYFSAIEASEQSEPEQPQQ